jgi:hypothetical protein
MEDGFQAQRALSIALNPTDLRKETGDGVG